MKKIKRYVGLDVHKDSITIAVADGGRRREVRLYGRVSSDLRVLERTLRKIRGEDSELRVVYEAGPTGFVIYRRLTQLKIDCIVVAPSKLPLEKGLRQKTDRRDAEQLARLHRAGELTAIYVPDATDEAMRDLTRARADAVHDQTRARLRLKSFLLRQGYHYQGKANWSEAHRRYLRSTSRVSHATASAILGARFPIFGRRPTRRRGALVRPSFHRLPFDHPITKSVRS